MVFQRVAHYKFPTQFMMYIQCISEESVTVGNRIRGNGPCNNTAYENRDSCY